MRVIYVKDVIQHVRNAVAQILINVRNVIQHFSMMLMPKYVLLPVLFGIGKILVLMNVTYVLMIAILVNKII